MYIHRNARLTQRDRFRFVIHHLGHVSSLAELAAENRISLRFAYRCLARYRSGGPPSLADHRSMRCSQGLKLDSQQHQQAVDFCHQQLHLRHIARLLQPPFSTVARALSRQGLGRLRKLDP